MLEAGRNNHENYCYMTFEVRLLVIIVIPLLFDYDFYYRSCKIGAAFSFDNGLVLVCELFDAKLDGYSNYKIYFNKLIYKYFVTSIPSIFA